MSVDYQILVDKLADFIELRFGVYLDTIMGFQHNLESFTRMQHLNAQRTKLSIEELDKISFRRGNGPPSPDPEESKKHEIHRMTQGDFKKRNSPGGANYDFAIDNCLSDIFNSWNFIKEELGLLGVDDAVIFPITAYMRALRNRLQHDLYPIASKGPITPGKVISIYSFPDFQEGQPICLTEKDIEALVLEVRAQLGAHLVPYINMLLTVSASPSP